MKLIMTKGLPASGKSTWAKEQVKNGNGRVKRVNKDDLRAMLDNSQWSKSNEKFVLETRDFLILRAINKGYDIIVDDTNLDPKHEATLRDIVREHNQNMPQKPCEFTIQDFTYVPLKTCLQRDAERANSVGEDVIRGMWKRYLRPSMHEAEYAPPVRNPELPNCIIVDIDGTLAHHQGRSPYDETKIDTDLPDPVIRDIVRKYTTPNIMEEIPLAYIVVVSGRHDTCKEETIKWLSKHGIPFDELFMRGADDTREDSVVKREIYESWIKPRYNVLFILDDRDRVVRMWRSLGLKVLQVAEGDF